MREFTRVISRVRENRKVGGAAKDGPSLLPSLFFLHLSIRQGRGGAIQQMRRLEKLANWQEVTMATEPRVHLGTRHTVFTVELGLTNSCPQKRVGG